MSGAPEEITREKALAVLKVEDGAKFEELKHAYHKQLLKWSPKRHNHSATSYLKCFDIREAFRFLGGYESDDDDIDTMWANQMTTHQDSLYRVRAGNGYLYFTTNDDQKSGTELNSKNRPRQKSPGRIVELDDNEDIPDDSIKQHDDSIKTPDDSIKQQTAKAEKLANELINEEDKAKKKAEKRRKKKQKQKMKKVLQSKEAVNGHISSKEDSGDEEYHSFEDNVTIKTYDAQNHIEKTTNAQRQNGTKEPPSTSSSNESRTQIKEKEKRKNSNPLNSKSNLVDTTADEPGWDKDSAFFAKVASNTRMKTKTGSKLQKEQVDVSVSRNLIKSREFAIEGNKLAAREEYLEAIKAYTKAINLHNHDCKYFGNRSLCFERLEIYDRALDDANTAILLSPEWPKGYFRQGKAFVGMKDLQQAEKSYEQVLRLESTNKDAAKELHKIQIDQLIAMGFARNICELALRRKGTVQLALDELLSGALSDTVLEDVYVSDEDEDALFEEELRKAEAGDQQSEVCSEVEYNSLWVGNITPDITEKEMMEYFGQFGEINNINTMYQKRCAFINYRYSDAAKHALLAGDTIDVKNTTLVIRYPDRAFQKTKPITATINNGECFYWRRKGCQFGDKCRFAHYPSSKGADLNKI